MNATLDNNVASLSKSILNHARAIHRYAKTYCENDTSDFQTKEERAKSRICVEQMLRELQGILTMARRKGVTQQCNLEQVAAYADAAREIIGAKQVREMVYRPELAILN